MGKSENIKRAKKLKEAKRKREQDALIEGGLGPAAKVLQERSQQNGLATTLNTGKIKYSEVLKKFVSPIITPSDDISIVKTKYTFCSHAWNASLLKEKNEELYLKVKKEILEILPKDPTIDEFFEEMVKRKLELFSEYNVMFGDIEIRKIRGLDYDLTVATLPFNDL
jgi:hypothetical protein